MQRENQRRSRTRQKELVDELRHRLERYERDGVQATSLMQASARVVAAENQCLRDLLASKGVSSDEVSDYLKSNGMESSLTLGYTTQIVTTTPPTTVGTRDTFPRAKGNGCQEIDKEEPLDHGKQEDHTQMSCDVAASIVASVQGHDDHVYVRSALGCTTPDCSVKTTCVFDIIDKATLY